MQDRIQPFEQHADRFESWFQRHPAAYASELAAVRELWPAPADGLEIGVGAGHFAARLVDAGFVALEHRQTLFAHPDGMQVPDPVRAGFGEGAFVVVSGLKPENPPC